MPKKLPLQVNLWVCQYLLLDHWKVITEHYQATFYFQNKDHTSSILLNVYYTEICSVIIL